MRLPAMGGRLVAIEEVVCGDYSLDQGLAMLVRLDAIGRNDCHKNGFAGTGHPTENLLLGSQLPGVLLADLVRGVAELHLTQIDDPVLAVNEQVNLHSLLMRVRGSVAPRRMLGLHTPDAQGPLQAADVRQAGVFKGVTAPGLTRRRQTVSQPPTSLARCSSLAVNPSQVEQRIFIDESINRVSAGLAERHGLQDEAGSF